MNIIENLTLDKERALYGTRNALIRNCATEGCDPSFENSDVPAIRLRSLT